MKKQQSSDTTEYQYKTRDNITCRISAEHPHTDETAPSKSVPDIVKLLYERIIKDVQEQNTEDVSNDDKK